jgi:hypothetical protein
MIEPVFADTKLALGLGQPLLAALAAGQPLLAALAAGQLGRQLIAAAITEPLVPGRVDLRRLLEDLARELLVIAGRALRRIGVDLRAVDGQHRDPVNPALAHSASASPNKPPSAASWR